jgi:hypothetical protein
METKLRSRGLTFIVAMFYRRNGIHPQCSRISLRGTDGTLSYTAYRRMQKHDAILVAQYPGGGECLELE